jgi:hypothetical protein
MSQIYRLARAGGNSQFAARGFRERAYDVLAAGGGRCDAALPVLPLAPSRPHTMTRGQRAFHRLFWPALELSIALGVVLALYLRESPPA